MLFRVVYYVTMTKKVSVLFLFFLFIFCQIVFAQNMTNFRGKIIDKKTGEPVVYAEVGLKQIDRWTTTDANGLFAFKNIEPISYTFEVRCLGYETYSVRIDLGSKTNEIIKTIRLVPTSLDMPEVSVIAKKGSNIASTTRIGNAAIQYIQPTSLGDIMQLLPGNVAENPDLSKPQQISIREIGTDANSAMGTAIVIDGAPVSNDANLQTLSSSIGQKTDFNSVAGVGVDLREISTGNIESIKVIKGVPSVVYGNLTSGVVVVRTKAGYSPFRIQLKANPYIKQISVNKGIRLSNKARDFLNVNLDYIQSYFDVRSKYKGFSRITGSVAYSGTFFKKKSPLSFNAKIDYFGTIDNTKTDPDAMVANEEYWSKNNGVRMDVHGRWTPHLKFLTNLHYIFSLSYTHQVSYQKKYRNTNEVEAISTALTEGENDGIFLPTEELTELTVDGKPVNIFLQLTGEKVWTNKKGLINKLLFGWEYRMSRNVGDGQIYDITNPPFISSHTTRPRSFKDIPPLRNNSIYLEDKIIIPIKTTKMTIRAGARLDNFQSSGLFHSNLGVYAEPRLNCRYTFLTPENNKFFSSLSVHFGIGKTYKSPPLLYLYPDKAYFDLLVLDYYTGNPATERAVFYSLNYNTENHDLKPSMNLKKEIGIDFTIGKFVGNITYFHENLTNGYSFERHYVFINTYKYLTDGIPPGTRPDLSKLKKKYFSYIIGYSYPVNDKESEKRGVEFWLNFGKIKSLYTSFSFSGAWLKTIRVFNTTNYDHLPNSASGTQYPNIGVYPAGESKISERLNTSLRVITQIPRLRMIFSFNFQVIWFNKYYYPFYDDAPIYLYDKVGNITPFTSEMRNDPNYIRYVVKRSDTYYLKEVMPPLLLVNFRFSKEITNKMKLSVYANNFLNYRPMYQYKRSYSYLRRNPSIYFGAELRIKL